MYKYVQLSAAFLKKDLLLPSSVSIVVHTVLWNFMMNFGSIYLFGGGLIKIGRVLLGPARPIQIKCSQPRCALVTRDA